MCRGLKGLGVRERAFTAALGARLILVLLVSALTVGFVGPASAAREKASAFPKSKSGILGAPVQKLDQTQPLYLQGDELIYDNTGNRVIARGNVEIYYNNYVLLADEVTYDRRANTLTAVGNVRIKEPNGAVVQADRITLTDDFRDGFVQSLRVVAKDDTRIAARRAIRQEGSKTVYERGVFTPCKPCKTDPSRPVLWRIKAQRIIHDQPAASITYQDAAFELFGVPVMWLPYFSHPDPSVKRRSGFLVPEIGTSTDLGLTIQTPYYFALSPNYDFLFNPMYTSKQGMLWQGEWRHRLARGQYTIKFAGIDQDDRDEITATTKGPLEHRWRGSVETKGQLAIASWWNLGWHVTLESDDAFRRFYKLDNILQTDRVNTIYMTGIRGRNYFGAYLYHFGGLLLDDTKTSNSEARVHPVIDYNYIFARPVVGGELKFDSNVMSLTRDAGPESSRVVAQFTWRRRLIDGLGQVFTPFAQVRGDAYYVANALDPDTGLVHGRETITRGMATVAMTYQYPLVMHTKTATHIVEPTAQIVARPTWVPNKRVPNEDALSLVFDDTLLFDVDKFSGYDRIETGTRANVGIQYTFQLRSGAYMRAVLGQSYQISDSTPFTPGTGLETRRSDYVTGLYIAPTSSMRFVGQARFDERDLALRRSDVSAYGSWGPFTGTVTYSYTKDDPVVGLFSSQQELVQTAQIKLTDHWYLLGQLRYDLDARTRLQDTIGVKYADECFVVSVNYSETFITNPTQDIRPDRSVMLRFELKHLGAYGFKSDPVQSQINTLNQPPKF
ncbi:MAG: LPS-assembly protein LptD [Hyphomicrobiaceae bacterium]